MKLKKNIIIFLVAVASIGGFIFVVQQRQDKSITQDENSQSLAAQDLTPVKYIDHGHGLAVDVADPSRIYIATHHGLVVLIDEKDLYQVGDANDDYMGFSPHPTDPKVFFTSGHPSTGGNIGVQKSVDGGNTWAKISDGVNGPVDFHALAVSPVNPELLYGWYQGAIQRSIDGGKNWEIVSRTSVPIVNLVADPKDENLVYAASSQGLMVSKNKGVDWTLLFSGFTSAIAVDPNDSSRLLSFSENNGLAESKDSGKTWTKVNENFNGETPLFIAHNKQNPEIAYILTEKNSIYKSIDNGISWSRIEI